MSWSCGLLTASVSGGGSLGGGGGPIGQGGGRTGQGGDHSLRSGVFWSRGILAAAVGGGGSVVLGGDRAGQAGDLVGQYGGRAGQGVDRARACNAGKLVHLLLVQDFIDVCFRAGLVGSA